MRTILGLCIPLLACSGCFTVDLDKLAKEPPQKQRYLFDVALPAADASASAGEAVLVVEEANALAPYNARPFVTRTGDHEHEQDYYHEFLISPATQISQIAREWLRTTRAYPLVAISNAPLAADAILEIDLTELRGDYRVEGKPVARLAIRASLFDVAAEPTKPRVLFQNNYVAQSALADTSPATLVKGWNQAVAEVLGKLSADVRRVGRRAR